MKYKSRFLAFFIAMTLFCLSSNYAHPVTPTIIHNLGLHDYMFGLALAVMMAANFLFSPFWGKINLYISSGRSLCICCIGYGLAQLGFAYSTTELAVLLCRLLAGVFVGGIMVGFMTYVVNAAKPEDQGKYLTISATINAVAGAFGYLIGGVIGEFSIRATFLIQTATLCLTGILFLLVCQNDAQKDEKPSVRVLISTSNPLQAFIDGKHFMNKGFALLFLLCILINFANTGFDQAFNYYLKDQLSLTSSYNGIIKAAVGMITFLFNTTLCVWIIKKTDCRLSLTVLVGVCTLSAVCTLLTPKIWMFILWSVLVYAGYSVSIPVLQSIIADQADPAQKNLVMGFYNAAKSLGSVVGSLTAGFIYALHAKLPFACVALVYGVSIVVALGYRIFSKRSSHPY